MSPLRRTALSLFGFVHKPIISCSQLLITKKPADFDYVALDASGLVGSALRLSKNVNSEQRRHKEVARHVVQGVQQILKRISCRSSLLIALDGAEPLVKAAATRSAPLTRRLESRLARLPGTALMQAVEERLVRMMPDRAFLPREVVISGTGVAGCVEEKMSAWALDLACRADFHGGSGQSLALVGPQELYMNALALTPYYNVSSLVQGQGADVRQITLTQLLEFLGLEELATGGSSQAVARARTDVVFLLLLCNGGSAAELSPVANLRFPALFSHYRETVLHLGAAADAKSLPTKQDRGHDDAGQFLFSDVPGNKLELNLEALAALLMQSIPSAAAAVARLDGRVDSYLELALQAHASLCLGTTPDPLYLPLNLRSAAATGIYNGESDSTASALTVSALQLCSHLLALIAARKKASTTSPTVYGRTAHSSTEGGRGRALEQDGSDNDAAAKVNSATATVTDEEESSGDRKGVYNPFFSPLQPLTAAEFTMLSHSTTPGVEAVFHLCMNSGHSVNGQPPQHLQPQPKFLKKITSADTGGALTLVREALSFASAEKPHHIVCFSPSYYWTHDPRTKLWRMAYVDLGTRSAEKEVRRLRNAMSGVSMVLQTANESPCIFDEAKGRWAPLTQFPLEEDAAPLPTESETSAESAEIKDAAPTEWPVGTTTASTAAAKERPPRTLKVLTWNVMFDRYSGQPTPLGMPGIDWCSPKRYPVLAKLIEAEDADVVGMQEVETAFLQYLADQPWCRARYVLSCTPDSAVISPWGVAMLVHRRRFPVNAITHVNIPAWSGHLSLMPIVTLALGHGVVHVAAVHLLAPFTKNNENARTEQDQALRLKLTKGISGSEDCVAMGDFNDWPANEFVMPTETQYRECWPLVHPRDRGNTMDETNTFCKLKIEEIFFGRSDKVFLRSQRLRPVGAHLVGTRSVNEENGNSEAPAYLFPSDHYGVSVTFAW